MEDILNPSYWAERLRTAPADNPHHAIFRCSAAKWAAIETKHKDILKRHVKPKDFILDVGCGYGRLLSLLPERWRYVGWYLGFDISPDMIGRATKIAATTNAWGALSFAIHDIQEPIPLTPDYFDLAILISFRPMVKRNLGDEVWVAMEANIRKVSKKLLYLEYDELDNGSLE